MEQNEIPEVSEAKNTDGSSGNGGSAEQQTDGKKPLPTDGDTNLGENSWLSFAAWQKTVEDKLGRKIEAHELETIKNGVVGFVTIGSVTYLVLKGYEKLANSKTGQIVTLREFIKRHSTGFKTVGALTTASVGAWLITSPEARTMVGNALTSVITNPQVAGVSAFVACLVAICSR